MKVLMVGPARSVKGGISAVVNNYYKAKLDEKVEIKYVATMEDGSKLGKLLRAVRAFFEYARILSQYPMVHIHLSSDKSLCRKIPFILLAAKKKKKLIIHQHGGNFEDFYYRVCTESFRRFISRTLQKTDIMLVVAPHLKEIFGKIISPEKIRVFPNAIPVPGDVIHDYTGKKILFLGRLCKEKGIDELLDAVIELKQEFFDLEVYLGGIWEDLELKKKADNHREWIYQLGWIGEEEKQKYLRKCNIFVLPTYFEGLPVSLLEGMAYGCACIATNVGSIPQIMEDKNEGIIIEPGKKDEIIEAIRSCFNDSVQQERMGHQAKEKITQQYELFSSVEKLLEIYRGIIGWKL